MRLDLLETVKIASGEHGRAKIPGNAARNQDQIEIDPEKDTPTTARKMMMIPIAIEDRTTGENEETDPPTTPRMRDEARDEKGVTDTALALEMTRTAPTAAIAPDLHRPKNDDLDPAVLPSHHQNHLQCKDHEHHYHLKTTLSAAKSPQEKRHHQRSRNPTSNPPDSLPRKPTRLQAQPPY
jgi:hypothetical protein